MGAEARAWALATAGYVALAVALTWPLALHLGTALPGFPNVDLFDTAWLRLATARGLLGGRWPWTDEIMFPAGYPVGGLVPNQLDHLLGAPLALLLPWPASDGLWWLAALAANGLAGHALGRRVGGGHGAGALVGVALASAEPVLREANLGHAPTALVFPAALCLSSLLDALGPGGRDRHAALAGAWAALAALAWWYMAPFLAVLGGPLAAEAAVRAWRRGDRRVARRAAIAVGVAAALALPFALLWLGGSTVTRVAAMPELALTPAVGLVPEASRWAFSHGSDPLWPLRAEPLDRANRLSLALLAAAALGWRRTRPGERRALAAAAVAAGILVLGPYLKWGEDPVTVGAGVLALPGRWLAELPPFDRLSWPQRWGLVCWLALLPLAARAPRAAWFAPVVLLEAFLLSGNAPLATTPVGQYAGWRALAAADGGVLVLPLDPAGPPAPALSFAYRTAGRPFAAAYGLPPQVEAPAAWEAWRRSSPFVGWAADVARGADRPLPDGALAGLRAEGFAAVALDATPGGATGPRSALALARRLAPALGEPADHGSALVWWIDPPSPPPAPLQEPDRWRARQEAILRAWPDVAGPTILRPVPLE